MLTYSTYDAYTGAAMNRLRITRIISCLDSSSVEFQSDMSLSDTLLKYGENPVAEVIEPGLGDKVRIYEFGY
jgi:hypothetical protein